MAIPEITLDERNHDNPIEYDGGKNEVSAGCVVDLEHNGVRITARVTKADGQTWTGEVTGFPNEDAEEHGNLKVGATIEFEDRHVFRCAA